MFTRTSLLLIGCENHAASRLQVTISRTLSAGNFPSMNCMSAIPGTPGVRSARVLINGTLESKRFVGNLRLHVRAGGQFWNVSIPTSP